MITRLTIGDVPSYQIILSLIGLASTAYLFILIASRLFSADNLLSSEGLSWNWLKGALRKKE